MRKLLILLIACVSFVFAVSQLSAEMEDNSSKPGMEQGDEIEYPSDEYDSEDEGSGDSEDTMFEEEDTEE